jgi:hypothetical protein
LARGKLDVEAKRRRKEEAKDCATEGAGDTTKEA